MLAYITRQIDQDLDKLGRGSTEDPLLMQQMN